MKKYLMTILVAILCVVLGLGVLTACKETKYTVTYVGGDGATGTAPTEADHAEGDVFKLAQNSFVKEGYTFAGWNDGSKTYLAGVDYTMPAANVTLTAQWNKNKPANPDPVENLLAGLAFYSFSANTYCEFTDEVDADGYYQVIYAHNAFDQADQSGLNAWVGNLNTVRYSVTDKYVAEVKQGDKWVELFSLASVNVDKLELDGDVYYKVGAEHSVTIAQDDGANEKDVVLVYTLGMNVTLNRTPDAKEELNGYATVNHEIEVVSYDGHQVSNASYAFISNKLTLMYVVDATTYQASINLGDNTSVLIPYGVVLTAEATISGQQYTFRATFVDKMSDEGYRTLSSFEVLEDSNYRQILSSSVNRSNPDGQGYTYVFSDQVGNVKTTYTVRFVDATGDDAATFTVEGNREVTPTTVTVYTADNQYKAILQYTDPAQAELNYFGKINGIGEYSQIWASSYYYGSTTCSEIEANLFEVVVAATETAEAITYRVLFVPATDSEDAQLVVSIVGEAENQLAGTRYYDWANKTAWEFTDEEADGHFKIKQYKYANYMLSTSETAVYYTLEDGVYTIYTSEDESIASFDTVSATFTAEIGLFYKAGVSHTVNVTQSGEQKVLTFTFALRFETYYIYADFSNATYDGHDANATSAYSASSGYVYLEYEEGDTIYQATITMATFTSTLAVNGKIVYSKDQQYKGVFDSSFYYLTLYKNESGSWEQLSNSRTYRTSANLWNITLSAVGGVTPIYVVKYYAGDGDQVPYITVGSIARIELTKENHYRATFEIDAENDVELIKLEYYSGGFSTIYWSSYPSSYGTVEKQGNVFTVTYGVLSVTITFIHSEDGDVSKSDFTYQDNQEEPEPSPDNQLAGSKYFDWANKVAWVFSSKVGDDGHYVIKQYSYASSTITFNETAFYYTIDGEQYHIYNAENNLLATLNGADNTIVIGAITYYKTGVSHSFSVSEDDDSKTFVLTFNFEVKVSDRYSIAFTGSDYSYDGHESTQITAYTFSNDNWVVEYEYNGGKYRATVTMSTLESSVALYSTIIYLDDQYKAEFSGGTATGFYYLTFSVKNGESWQQVGWGGDTPTSDNVWKIKGDRVGIVAKIYLVTYIPAHDDQPASITVVATTELQITLDSEAGYYTVRFEIDASGKVTLTYVYDETNWSQVYSSTSDLYGTAEKLGDNTFYVEYKGYRNYELTITLVLGSADDYSDATFTAQQGKVTPED